MLYIDSNKIFIGTTIGCIKRSSGKYFLINVNYFKKTSTLGLTDKDTIISYYEEYIQAINALEHNLKFITTASNPNTDIESLRKIKFVHNSKITNSKSHFISSESFVENYIMSILRNSISCIENISYIVNAKENQKAMKDFIRQKSTNLNLDAEYTKAKEKQTNYTQQANELIEKIANKEINFDSLKEVVTFEPVEHIALPI